MAGRSTNRRQDSGDPIHRPSQIDTGRLTLQSTTLAGSRTTAPALQGHSAIYGGGYLTNLRDITSGTNGSCGTDCTAGTGYDLVTGLGSPVNYP